MEVNDRGTKKWSSIMLPEHVKALKQVFAEQEYKEKPILDDQQKVEIDLKLQIAIQNDLTIEIEYFRHHDFHKIKDKVLMIDSLNGYLRLEKVEKLPVNDIIDVEIL